MPLIFKQLLRSMQTLGTWNAAKTAAYCATICLSTSLLFGCASTTARQQALVENDPLAPQQLQQRAAQITSVAQAEQIEQAAIARQNAADVELKNAQADCYRRFLVNYCLRQQLQKRNDLWDQAQIERSAARLYIRQAEAEQQRLALMRKIKAYQAQEAARAGERARNAAEYAARQQAHREKLARAQALEAAQAAERAQNVEDFNAKVKRIEAIKQQRILKAQQEAEKATQSGTAP